jgi:hypothetical protein
MGLPVGSLEDPVPDLFDLRRGELAHFLRGRHPLFAVGMGDVLKQEALRGIAGDHDGSSFTFGEPILSLIETKSGLALGGVHSVTFEAGIGEDGADLAGKFNWFASPDRDH